MGKINGCLKCLFIFFNVLFEIVGCVLLYGAIKTLGYAEISQFGGPSLVWIWVFAFGFLGISSLGIYAACSENTIALKIFAGFMGAGMIIMIIFGIYIAVVKNQVDDLIHTVAKTILDEDGHKEVMEQVHRTFQCCGILSLDDWHGTIPQSCSCSEDSFYSYDSPSKCRSKPAGSTGPERIYAEPCANIFKYYVNLIFSVALGFYFGFAAIALMGLLISLFMVHQLKKYEGAGAAMPMKSY
ncbi:Tetraspanin-5 [Oryzias melastigma]|uniref:Tetraspanin n=1 Tax=Oryzias melastigma TaxID=30732 RepID=A0A3B3CVH4_ORYME|nr:23 kDa integral membrane protein [Oryzias melastigma]KAF6714481.1 Tetraspanin-5 [Oryzias melastigma]